MNQKQREYAIGRVDAIAKAKTEAVKVLFTKPAKELSNLERIELFRKNKVKVKPHVTQASSYADLRDVFDFTPFEYPAIPDHKRITPLVAAIEKEAARVRDQVMLGGEAEALALISAFEASSVS